MQVDTAIEYSSGILANGRGDQSFATRMVLNKIAHVVNDTSNRSQCLAVLRLFNKVIPVNHRELFQRHAPIQLAALLINLLLLLLQPTLVNLVLAEGLKVGSETELLPGPDAPLGGVVLVPDDGITVVRGELVVEVVVSFAKRDESRDDVVSGAVSVVEGLLAKPVSETVDAEGGLLNHKDTEDSSVDESTNPVAPAEASNKRGEDESHEDNTLHKVPVLPNDDGVLVQIGDVGTTNSLRILLHDHPADVAVQKTFPNGIGIFLGVGVSMVSSVTDCGRG